MVTVRTRKVSPTRYFWAQLGVLGAGFTALFLARDVAWRLDGPVARADTATALTLAVVAAALAAVGRAVYVIVTAGFSDAHRVFRSRHLLMCGVLLAAVALGAAGAVFARGPFGELFAYGMITGEDIVDAGTFGATLVCLVGAGVAASGAWDRMRIERNWSRHF
jgi:hypothetical protein